MLALYGIIRDNISLIFAGILLVVAYIFKSGAKDYKIAVEVDGIIETIENCRSEWLTESLNEQQESHKEYLKEKEDFKKMIDIAKGVQKNDMQSFTYAINFFNPFDDLKDYGSDISFNAGIKAMSVDFFVHSGDVIPNTTKRILRKGLEIKEDQIPASRFNEIYQDYVCSCVLRIAKEVFQLLPINKVQINAKGAIMNSATGNNEEKTIVSVSIEKDNLEQLNFELLDPSDSMSNFSCNMSFKKNEGFKPVDELQVK